jgi:CubicO group peptidase (beta-lactamase class C family)
LTEPRPDCPAAADHILHAQFDFEPGERVAYSNAGYCLLGRILLLHEGRLPLADRAMLKTPLGAAGGWLSTPRELHARLLRTFPLRHIEPSVALPDGSHYDFGWRHWQASNEGPPWTHFGRLPGLMTLAVTDGRTRLLVAYFDGDPRDVDQTSSRLARSAWRCMQLLE